MAALSDILQGALSLETNERALLAERLLASLDEPLAEDESLWVVEAERRLRDCRSDLESNTVSADSLHQQLLKSFE